MDTSGGVFCVDSGFGVLEKLNNLICAFWTHVAMLSATLTFAQTHHCDITETILCCWEVANASKVKGEKLGHGGMWKIPWIQLSSWGNNITWSSWGIKIRHPYDQYSERANNTPPSMANMLNRVITSTLSSWGNKLRHPLWPICWTG